MEKFFNALLKPAKWILVIGSLVYATWFAVQTAGSINGTFMSVVSNLLILIVGSALLFSVPVLILLKKEDMAKIAFFILGVGHGAVFYEVKDLAVLTGALLHEEGITFHCDSDDGGKEDEEREQDEDNGAGGADVKGSFYKARAKGRLFDRSESGF